MKIVNPIKIIAIEAICTPTICSNVLNQDVKTVSSNYEHLKQIELADSSLETTKCIDVLMGVNYYYYWITGEVKRGKDYESLAINSMLRLDCTNTELLNKFEEIKTENVFNNDLKKLFNTENYEEEINDDVYLSFKRNLHFDNKKREIRDKASI